MYLFLVIFGMLLEHMFMFIVQKIQIFYFICFFSIFYLNGAIWAREQKTMSPKKCK
jgi:hypothetical protein